MITYYSGRNKTNKDFFIEGLSYDLIDKINKMLPGFCDSTKHFIYKSEFKTPEKFYEHFNSIFSAYMMMIDLLCLDLSLLDQTGLKEIQEHQYEEKNNHPAFTFNFLKTLFDF